MGELWNKGIRQTSDTCRPRRMACIPVALAQKTTWASTENRALHRQRDEAHIQIRCEMGLFERKPNGRETCRIAPGFHKAIKAACTANRVRVLCPAEQTWPTREISSCFCRLAGTPHQRSLWVAMARPRLEPRSRILSTRFRSWEDHLAENGSLSYQPASARGGLGLAARVAHHHSIQSTGRLGLRFSLH
jgi:hypothetical protein